MTNLMTNLMTNQSNNEREDFKANYLWNPEINEYVFSTIAASSLLECSEGTVRKYCEILNISRKTTRLQTGGQNRLVATITLDDFELLLEHLNPELLRKIRKGGIKFYVYGRLGLLDIPEPVQPVKAPKTELTQVEICELALERARLSESTIELPGLASIDQRRIDFVKVPNQLPGYFTLPEFLDSHKLPNTSLHTFYKRANYAFKLQTQNAKPKLRICVNKNGRKTKIVDFPTSFLPTLFEIYDQVL